MLPKSGIRRMYIYVFAVALLFIVIGMWNSMRVDGLGEVTPAHHITSCRLP
jgi:hypothetical protein